MPDLERGGIQFLLYPIPVVYGVEALLNPSSIILSHYRSHAHSRKYTIKWHIDPQGSGDMTRSNGLPVVITFKAHAGSKLTMGELHIQRKKQFLCKQPIHSLQYSNMQCANHAIGLPCSSGERACLGQCLLTPLARAPLLPSVSYTGFS